MQFTEKEKNLFRRAKQISLTSAHQRSKIGAVILRGTEIVSSSANQLKSHPKQSRANQRTRYQGKEKLHAEVGAIIRAGRADLSDCSIFVYRETKTGLLANCRPCGGCFKEIKAAGIKHVYYTTEEGYHYVHVDHYVEKADERSENNSQTKSHHKGGCSH